MLFKTTKDEVTTLSGNEFHALVMRCQKRKETWNSNTDRLVQLNKM